MGVTVGIASPAVSVQKLFPLPVSTSGFVVDIYVTDVGRCRTMSSVIFVSGMVENVGVVVGVVSTSDSVQKLFPLPVSTSGFVAGTCVSDVGQRRVVSAVSFLSRAWSIMWG